MVVCGCRSIKIVCRLSLSGILSVTRVIASASSVFVILFCRMFVSDVSKRLFGVFKWVSIK